MQIKFIALIFATLALLAVSVTAFREHRFGYGGGCACSGWPEVTRRCCELHGGFPRFDRCHYDSEIGFLECCELKGLLGVCTK